MAVTESEAEDAQQADAPARTPRRYVLIGGLAIGGVIGGAAAPLLGRRGAQRPSGADWAQSPYAEDIDWLAEWSIIDPAADGPFRPAEVITRAETAVLFYRFAGSPEYPSLSLEPFRDVPENAQDRTEILWMRGQGVVLGTFDANFRPTEQISRGEACALFFRLLGVALARHQKAAGTTPDPDAPSAFSDVPVEHRYASALRWAEQAGLITGQLVPDGRVRPDQLLRREEMAHLLRSAEQLFAI